MKSWGGSPKTVLCKWVFAACFRSKPKHFKSQTKYNNIGNVGENALDVLLWTKYNGHNAGISVDLLFYEYLSCSYHRMFQNNWVVPSWWFAWSRVASQADGTSRIPSGVAVDGDAVRSSPGNAMVKISRCFAIFYKFFSSFVPDFPAVSQVLSGFPRCFPGSFQISQVFPKMIDDLFALGWRRHLNPSQPSSLANQQPSPLVGRNSWVFSQPTGPWVTAATAAKMPSRWEKVPWPNLRGGCSGRSTMGLAQKLVHLLFTSSKWPEQVPFGWCSFVIHR